MRWLLIAIAFASLGIASASAKPKVAVTVDGDADDKMGETVREVLEGKLAVVTPKDVERAMSKLGLSAPLAEDDVQKLRERLDAAVVVQGKLGKAGAKKTVRLTVWVRGKKPSDFNVQYKTAGSEKFRDTVRDALLKRIGSIDELESGEEKPKKKRLNEGDEVKDKDEDKDKDKPKKKRLSEGDEDKDKDKDKPKKKAEGDEDKDKDKPKKKRLAEGDEDKDKPKKKTDPDEDKPKKRVAEGDGNGEGEGEGEGDKDKDKDKPKKKKKVATAEDGDGNTRVRKRRRSSDGDGEGVSEPEAAPLPAARVDAGVGYGARYLTFAIDATSTNRPPKVLTPAISGRIEGEIYPLAFSNRRGAGAGLALFGEYAKTLGLSITIPNGMGKAASINQAHYMLGAGYRLALGKA
ncbi:MAG TPA: hypothetical protein VNO30_08025, partial [Kofleriaceae bacterium]|nr:hypothetical protein [Kofleriaceae bacterium]